VAQRVVALALDAHGAVGVPVELTATPHARTFAVTKPGAKDLAIDLVDLGVEARAVTIDGHVAGTRITSREACEALAWPPTVIEHCGPTNLRVRLRHVPPHQTGTVVLAVDATTAH
jgi:hypothetical protein